MKYILLIWMFFGWMGFSFSQGNVFEFSLSEAQEYALKNNKNLKNVQNDIKLALYRIDEAMSAGLPKISGSMDYMTNFNYEFEFALGGTPNPPTIDFTKLDNGDLEVLGVIDQMFGSSEPATIKMGDQLAANLKLTQLLFSGQFWVGLRMAKLAGQLAEKGIEVTEVGLKEQVVNTYQMILVTEELLRIMQENEEKLLEIHKHTQNMFDAGMAEQTDVDQLSVNISQLRNGVKSMKRNVELSYNMLRFILGLDEKAEISLTTSLGELLENLIMENLNTEEFDLNDNPAYRLLKDQVTLNEENIKLQKWAYAPTLLGYYSYKEKILTSGFDLSPNHAAGLSLSVPIWDGGSTHVMISKAKIELDKARLNQELARDQLMLQNEQVKYDLQSAFENFSTQKESVEVAKRVLVSYENKYKQGMISSLELTQANVNYLQSENNYVSSTLDLLRAKLAMDKLYNKL